MIITNKTKQIVLSNQAKRAQSFKDKTTGLIGAKPTIAMVFTTRLGIHTFGMRFPIDILVLDKSHVIKEMKESMLPNRIFLWHPKYDTVIELPKGTITKSHTEIGDTIKFQM